MKLPVLLLGVFCFAVSGCQTMQHGGSSKSVKTELYFGSAKPDGRRVSPQEWNAFVTTEITPRFPEGLTLLDGVGQWRGQGGVIVREETKVLVLIHPPTKEANAQIEALRSRYKERFEQESVLKVSAPVKVAF
jgi:hypothetical protein